MLSKQKTTYHWQDQDGTRAWAGKKRGVRKKATISRYIDALCAENAELRLISEADGRRIQELVAENKRLEGIIEQLRVQLTRKPGGGES